MKKLLTLGLAALLLTGCASEYLLITNNGDVLTSYGKPELDKDTGMLEFEDSEGRKQQIPQTQVRQMLER